MRAGWLVLLCGLSLAVARGQLAAPVPFSTEGGCSRSGCEWVPDAEVRQSFRRRDLRYTVAKTEFQEDHGGGEFILSRRGKVLLQTPLADLLASVSVVWSPDSRWFAVTWSDGGSIGNFYTRLFRVSAVSVREYESPQRPYRLFKRHHFCAARGDNLQALGWDRPRGALILVASVYATGDCGSDSGHTEAFFIRPETGAVIRHLNDAQLSAYLRRH